MRKNIVAGNWKMNNDSHETKQLLETLRLKKYDTLTRVMVAPAFTHLAQANEILKSSSIAVLAQNMNAAPSGAFTGEISAKMLKSISVDKVILGHSERRAYYNETNSSLAEKVKTAVDHQMEIIFCFGEELAERRRERHFEVVKEQLSVALFDLPVSAWRKIILAYEPVWAIGTGETAAPEQTQEMHAFVRNLIQDKYSSEIASEISILYGGSVKPNNAKAIFSKPDVDGGLIGGAALNVDDFMAIVNAF